MSEINNNQNKNSHDKNLLLDMGLVEDKAKEITGSTIQKVATAINDTKKSILLPLFSNTNKYRQIIIATVIFIILVLGGILYMVSNNITNKGKQTNHPRVTVVQQEMIQIDFEKLELATKSEERQRGFMFRDEICDRCGMLFVFPEESELTFWMPNVYFPLDLIFMDQSGIIVKIHENTTPNNDQKKYFSEKPAQYALETKSGFVKSFGLKEGQKVDIQHLQKQGVKFVWFNIDE